jgi:pyruvate kinase
VRPLRLRVPKDARGDRTEVLAGYLDLEASYTELQQGTLQSPGFVIAARGAKSLESLSLGEMLTLHDARGAMRGLRVVARISSQRVRVEMERSAYVEEGSRLVSAGGLELTAGPLWPSPAKIRVRAGDVIRLYRDPGALGHAATAGAPAGVSCTVPEALDHVQVGHRVFIDDGRIATRVVSVEAEHVELIVTSPVIGTARVRPEKGLNFPDSVLALSAITEEDLRNLPFIVEHADAVALSFVEGPQDVRRLRSALQDLGRPDMPVIAKIERRSSVGNVGQILLEGLRQPGFAVMIARGDLAVEVGFEDLAIVQEDILNMCEAAHVPVIWATQVLETLAKTGLPARAEITDAATGQRAECVMLNKGAHIADAVQVLAELLVAQDRQRLKKRQIFQEFTRQVGIFDQDAGPGA